MIVNLVTIVMSCVTNESFTAQPTFYIGDFGMDDYKFYKEYIVVIHFFVPSVNCPL